MRKLGFSGRLLVSAAALAAIGSMAVHFGLRVLYGHETEARYVEMIQWTMPNISRSYALSYTELGPQANRVPLVMRTIAGRLCATGAVFGFDVDDAYAFDIDEPVDLTLTYAPDHSGTFTVHWDANGGEGIGQTSIEPEGGAPLREITVPLDRARFAGQGTLGIDIALRGTNGLAICGIEVSRSGQTVAPRSSGRVRLQIRDAESGDGIAARVGLYDESGRLPLPSDEAVLITRFSDRVRRLWLNGHAFWPSANRQAFYVDESYEATVPAGTYELVVTRGIEYHAHTSTIEIRPNETTEATIELRRYADLAARGWYSGDGHVHIGRTEVRDTNVWKFAAAEDIRVTNLVQMGNLARTHFDQPAWGEAGRFEQEGYVILSAQEDPRTVQHGHTLHYNLEAPIHLATDEYFAYHDAFEEVSRQGGSSGYAHHGQLFNGRRGLALDVPFGLVDFIEVLQNGRLATEPWYDYLNLGYKILPDAGSDFPYMDLPGVVRNYVAIDGPFSADAWFEAFSRGNMYVTNGPFLEFTVNGQPMGSELNVPRNSRLEIVAEADINPEVDSLSHLELVVHGEVVATQRSDGSNRITLRTEIPADRSKWIAVRAFGSKQDPSDMTAAHSAPIYVIVDGEPFWKQEAVPELVAQQRQRLDEFLTAEVNPRGDLEPWETLPLMEEEWERQRTQLEARVNEARSRYAQLEARATGETAAAATRLAGSLVLLAGTLTALRIRLSRRRTRQVDGASG